MDKIIETLVRLAPGKYEMKKVVAEIGIEEPAWLVGKMVSRYRGQVLKDVVVKLERVGVKLFVSLQNVKVMAPLPARADVDAGGKACNHERLRRQGGW